MDRRLGYGRLAIGRDLLVVAENADGVEVEGRPRLRPGREIEIVRAPGPDRQTAMRRALVCSWRVVRVNADGVLFRGFCQWV